MHALAVGCSHWQSTSIMLTVDHRCSQSISIMPTVDHDAEVLTSTAIRRP